MAVWEILLALLAAVGAGALVWLLIRRLLSPAEWQTPFPGAVILSARGDGSDLEQAVKTLRWCMSPRIVPLPLIIVDLGLDEEGSALARRLAEVQPGVTVCPPEELSDYIQQRK